MAQENDERTRHKVPMIDLHTHTTASDGLLSPQELVVRAVKDGIRLLAVTDHDTIAGVKPAMEAASNYALDFIPGVELSADLEQDELHILGYFIDVENQFFLKMLGELRDERIGRIDRILEKLEDFNVNPGIENVKSLASGEAVGRPHIARAMMKAGFVSSVVEAFEKYLGKVAPCYVPRKKFSPTDTVKLILKANGVPVVAHPGLIKNFSGIFPTLLEAGLMGIEAYHTDHSPEQVDYFVKLARKNNLWITAGSDFHGLGIGCARSPGVPGIDREILKEIYKVYERRMGNGIIKGDG